MSITYEQFTQKIDDIVEDAVEYTEKNAEKGTTVEDRREQAIEIATDDVQGIFPYYSQCWDIARNNYIDTDHEPIEKEMWTHEGVEHIQDAICAWVGYSVYNILIERVNEKYSEMEKEAKEQ